MAAAREKDEWRFATMEYGEQCSWDEVDANVVCRQMGYGQPGTTITNQVYIPHFMEVYYSSIQLQQVIHLEWEQDLHYSPTSFAIPPTQSSLNVCTPRVLVSKNVERAGVICPESSTISPSISYTYALQKAAFTRSTSNTDASFIVTLVPTMVSTIPNKKRSYTHPIAIKSLQQRKVSSDVFSTVSMGREERLRIIFVVVGGVLALVIITAISVGVMIARRRKSENNLGGETLYMHV